MTLARASCLRRSLAKRFVESMRATTSHTECEATTMTQIKLWLAIASNLVVVILCVTSVSALESSKSPPVTPSTPIGAELVGNPSTNSANLILNGDFEIFTVAPGCYYNLSNSEVTAALPNIVAYGTAEEIDLMTLVSCPFTIAPQR